MKMASPPVAKTATSDPRGGMQTRALPADLRQLERLFDEVDWPDRRAFLKARRAARKRAVRTLNGARSGPDALGMGLLVAAAELFTGMRAELMASPEDAARLAGRIEDETGLSRLTLAREMLRSADLLTVSPADAVDTLLATLKVLAPLRSASLWTLDDTEQIQCTRHIGEGNPPRGAKQLAARMLAGRSAKSGSRRLLLGLPVGRWRQPLAALVASASPGAREACEAFLLEAGPMLGSVLERDALLTENAASERLLVESSERKLTRLGFDLHDGPIQDVAVVADDLRSAARQLDAMLEGRPPASADARACR